MKWHPHTEKPALEDGTTALLAERDEELPSEFYLLGIYLWRDGAWRSEESFKPRESEYWWVLEDELLAPLKKVAA